MTAVEWLNSAEAKKLAGESTCDSIGEKLLEGWGRAVLAEAERALRELRGCTNAGCASMRCIVIDEAADLLAGMRRCTCDRVDCESCGQRIAKRVTEGT